MPAPDPVDPATIPTLSGVFAPVHEEHDAPDLAVTGEIPADLRGGYVRNGPNPQFPPLGSYTFPLEGDPMLHSIRIDDDGSVAYRNRIVWSPQMRLEQAAGHALWAGLMTPYLPGPDVVPEQYANDWKPAPFINIVHHGGRWLALSEVDPPWEVTSALEVVGDQPFTWDGAIPGHEPAPAASIPRPGRWCCSATTSPSRTSCGRRSRPTERSRTRRIRSSSTART